MTSFLKCTKWNYRNAYQCSKLGKEEGRNDWFQIECETAKQELKHEKNEKVLIKYHRDYKQARNEYLHMKRRPKI